ncbi:GNAT family N-acetyltransferase [Kitasatospora sp. NPDC088346]|uniref:GNAT family N-acetyltransferase n=1 Tax=Kitasatospora sp. NPDC088346 TaxID=3364073 RepID=UPI0038150C74
MDTPPELITLDRVAALRCFNGEADLPELFRVIDEAQEHLRPWMPWIADHSLEATRDFLLHRSERWHQGTAFTYAIVIDGGAIAGTCQLFRSSDQPGVMGIGYWLHPAATGRGLATRAGGVLVREAFLLPGIEIVEIVHDPANRASGAVPARLGFTACARRPAERLAPGETGEEQVWQLTRRQAAARSGEASEAEATPAPGNRVHLPLHDA